MRKRTAVWMVIVIIMLMTASLARGIYLQAEKEVAEADEHKLPLIKNNPIFRVVGLFSGLSENQTKGGIVVPSNKQ